MSESEKTKSPSKGPSSDSKAAIRAKLNDPLINPRRLHETLIKEITKEVRYDVENETKLRAVTQGTVNYEQFRQMVLGAHIRPLEKKDKVEGCQNGKRPHVTWNTAVKNCSEEKTESAKSEGGDVTPTIYTKS